jgi:phage tail sheath gpL-like
MSTLAIVVNAEETQAYLQQTLKKTAGEPKEEAIALAGYLKELATGLKSGSVDVQTGAGNPVAASGTFTLASVPVDDTVIIGGVTLTAKAAPANENQFSQAGTNTEDAASLAAVINAHSVLGLSFSATSAAAVVTVTAKTKGTVGNHIPIAETGTSITASGAFLAGGTGGGNDTVVTYSLGV